MGFRARAARLRATAWARARARGGVRGRVRFGLG